MKMYTSGDYVVAIEETKKLLAFTPSPKGEVFGLLALLDYWTANNVAMINMAPVGNVIVLVGIKIAGEETETVPKEQGALPFPSIVPAPAPLTPEQATANAPAMLCQEQDAEGWQCHKTLGHEGEHDNARVPISWHKTA